MRSVSARGATSGAQLRRVLVPGESSKRLGLALVALGLVVVFSLRYSTFGTTANGIGIGLDVSSIAIAAVGTGALLISGNVDLSIGSMYGLISVLIALAVRETGDPLIGILVGLACGAAFGTINGLLVRYLKISPLIVTLAMLGVYRGLAFLFADGVSVFGFPDSFVQIGRERFFSIPSPVIVAAVVFLAGYVVMIRTVAGLRLFAVGGNRDAAVLAGVKADRLVTLTFAANGVLIGVVAILTTSRLGAGTPSVGTGFELDVLTAVILGGVAFQGGAGHPLGMAIGVITIGILNAGLIFSGAQDWWQQIAKGSLLLLALSADQLLEWRKGRARAVPSKTGDADMLDAERPVPESVVSLNSDALVTAGGESTVPATARGEPVFTCHGLTRSFGSVVAVRDVGFAVSAGEVVCLVGDNGAGKSTLIRLISGVVSPDSGTMHLGSEPLEVPSPTEARQAGIQTVYQDLALCPNLGVAHNVVLGDEPRTRGFSILRLRDDVTAQRRALATLKDLGVTLRDYGVAVRRLSGGQRQAVAIARVLGAGAKLVILDEPTAALGVAQTRQTLNVVRRLAKRGTGVILITHDIQTVFDTADRIVVLRLGSVIFDGSVGSITKLELVQLMAGLGVDGLDGTPKPQSPAHAANRERSGGS